MEEHPPVNNKECTIYRVPKLLLKKNKRVYTLQVISIRPLHHHSQKDLIITEPCKRQHCIDFLSRLDNKICSFKFFVKLFKLE